MLNGSYVATTSAASTTDKALYAAVMSKYAPSVNTDPNASANQALGYTAFLAFENGMSGLSGTVDAAAVEKQLQAATSVMIPLSGGITYTCDGKSIPVLKAVCSATTDVGVTNGSGVISNVQPYNPSTVYGG